MKTMHGLNETAQRASRMIGIIRQVADQTHLLALNASIEAARAGDYKQVQQTIDQLLQFIRALHNKFIHIQEDSSNVTSEMEQRFTRTA